MAGNDIEIKVVVDADGAIKAFDTLGNEVKATEQAVSNSGSGFTKFQANILTLSSAVDLAKQGFSLFKGAASELFGALQEASVLEGLDRGFKNLQESIGQNAEKTLPELRDATRGLVDDQTLLQASNKAVLLGVDKGEGKFGDLAASAIMLGRAMGQDAAKSIDDVTTALGRGSVQILDNLGVQLKMEEAYTRYAEILGRALTEEDKANAFRVVATEKILEKASALGDLSTMTLTAGDSAVILTNTYKNVTDEFIKGISSSTELGQALQDVSIALNDIDWKAVGKDIAALISIIAQAGAAFASLASDIALIGKNKAYEEIGGRLSIIASGNDVLTESVKKQIKEIQALAVVLPKNAENYKKLTMLLKDFVVVNDLSNDSHKLQKESFQKILPFIQEYAGLINTKAIQAIKKETDAVTKDTEEQKKLREEREKLIEGIVDQVKVIDQDLLPKLDGLLQSQIDGSLATQEQKDALKLLAEAYITAGGDAKIFDNTVKESIAIGKEDIKVKAEQAKAIEATVAASSAALDQISADYDRFYGSIAQSAGNGLMAIFNADDEKGRAQAIEDTFADIERKSGEMIGKAFGPAGEAIGGFLGELEGRFIGKTIGKLFFGKHFEVAAREEFAKSIQEMLGDFNLIIGDSAVNIGEIFSAQEATESWKEFAAAIQGSTEETSFMNDAFRGFFENLRTDTAEGLATFNGFIAAGDGLAQIFSELGLTADQFGTILAKNVGGELNNLQIMLDQLNISQEDFAAALEKAYLSGKITASEYIRDLESVEDLYAKGIPGAVGATDEAWKNFVEGALLDGAHAYDSLGDIAAEAAEAGITSFEGLRQKLIESGYKVEDVDKFFTALGENGINSMEDLGNVTIEQSARIVAALEKVDFPFLDDANDKLDEISQKLDAIDEEKYVTVYVNYEVQGEPPPGL